MSRRLTKRQAALRRRRLFFAGCFAVLAVIVLIIAGIISLFKDDTPKKPTPKKTASAQKSDVQREEKITVDETPCPVDVNGVTLDANYTRLLLVNEDTPLPEDYNYGGNTCVIPQKYLNGGNNRFDTGAFPYLKAMIDAARADGVQLYVWSPYRSFNDQQMVFENNVKSVMKSEGLSKEDAEKEVRKTVMYPGSSEHHTGLCCDFNMADYKFNDSEMFTWLSLHAADYGFVMRYSVAKEDITKVAYETWHWRFVGINRAKEMNKLDLCLEEYCKKAKVDNNAELAKK